MYFGLEGRGRGGEVLEEHGGWVGEVGLERLEE